MTAVKKVSLPHLRTFKLPDPPRFARVFGWMLGVSLVVSSIALVFVPWQQTIRGTGRVVAYSPTERQQHLHAPIAGRIENWHVVEGSKVSKGDPIVSLVDVDPNYVSRLESRLEADQERIQAARERAETYRSQANAYEKARDMKVQAARLKVRMGEQKLAAAKQKAQAAEASLHTAELNLERTKQLQAKGLTSQRQLELAELAVTTALAELNLTQASVSEAEANRTALEADVLRAEAEGSARVATARAEAEKASAEKAYAQGDFAKMQVELSRQASQVVRSPVDGTIVHIDGNEGGGIVKEGQHLAVLVPDTSSRAVELYVDGNDAPLVDVGRHVRLQFEGWPAVQFVGWPSVAVGTFGGQVAFVDPASMDGEGRIRILVTPDEDSQDWPEANVLRQQVRAKGWVLLDQVPLGWEIWRSVNGFPPALGAPRVVGAPGDPASPGGIFTSGKEGS